MARCCFAHSLLKIFLNLNSIPLISLHGRRFGKGKGIMGAKETRRAQAVTPIGLSCLRATRGARNPNLQVVVTHASHVCSQHSFGLPLRMNGMHITQYDHARLDLLSLVCHLKQRWSKSVLTFDRCRSHSVTFGYY